MFILFSSKTVELTDKFKKFLETKLSRLKKFSSLGIRNVNVIVDRVKRKNSASSDAKVEIIADIKGKTFAFQEVGGNVYQAFYRVYERLDQFIRKESKKRKRS